MKHTQCDLNQQGCGSVFYPIFILHPVFTKYTNILHLVYTVESTSYNGAVHSDTEVRS